MAPLTERGDLPQQDVTGPADMVVPETASSPAEPVSPLSRIIGISASLVGTQALTSVLGLAFWTLAARRFSAVDVGVAGATVSLMMLLSSLGTLGLGTLLIAKLPQTDQGQRRLLVRTCLTVCGLAGGLLALVVPVVAVEVFGADNLRPIGGTLWPLVGLAVATALMSAATVLDQAVLTVGVGNLQLERNVLASVVKVAALVGLSAAGLTGGSIIFLAWTIGTAVSLPLVSWRSRGGRSVHDRRRLVDLAVLKGLGRSAASHHALNITIAAALQILPVMVTVLLSARQNAYFNAAIMVSGFVFALPYAVSIGLFAAARGNENEVVARMRLTIPFGLAVSAVADLVLFPLAGPVLSIFGAQYSTSGVGILRLIVLAGLPFVIKDHFVALRRVQGRTTSAVIVMCGFLLVELAGAAVGARAGGILGLCTGWLIVLGIEGVVLSVPLVRAWRSHRGSDPSARPASGVTTELIPGRTLDPTELAEPAWRDVARGALTPHAPTAAGQRPEERTPPAESRAGRLGRRNLTGPTALVMAIGVLVLALAAAAGRDGVTAQWPQFVWVTGLVLIFLPALIRVIGPSTPSVERVLLAVAAAMMLQFSRLVLNPTVFAFHDELIHANTLRQIEQSTHLFSDNSLLPVSGYYPGLELVTDAVSRATGLSAFVSAVLVLQMTRLILVLAVLALVRLVTRSRRAAALAALVYAANPQMLFFNSQYSYQTLALPLAVFALYLFATRRRGHWWSLLMPMAALAMVTITHHLTALLLIAAFAVWAVVLAVLRRRHRKPVPDAEDAPRRRWAESFDVAGLCWMTGAGAGMFLLTAFNPGNPLSGYLSAIAGSSTTDVAGLADGQDKKALFADTAGTGPAWWEQGLLVAAVVLCAVAILPALPHLRRNWRQAQALGLILGLIALLYPVIPAGHLTRATAEVGDRASGFVFLGLGAVVAVWWWAKPRRGWVRAVFAAAAVVVFLGNIVLGSGPTSGQLPGPYEISADARSVDADNLAAAAWLAAHVPPDSVVYGDRTSGLLAAAYGDQDTILHVSSGIDASRLLLAPTFTPADLALIRQTHLAYLVVDTRLSDGLPHQQFYIESGEYGGDNRIGPVTAGALEKFSSVSGVVRVYDNGSLVIYDMQGLWK